MSSIPTRTPLRPSGPLRWPLVNRSCRLAAPSLAILAALCLLGCQAAAQAKRVNPGQEPAKYRVVCDQSFKQCERRAKEVCGRHYHVLNKGSSEPELEEVQVSGVSTTGPSQGLPGWKGELLIQCGRPTKALRLVRKQGPPPSPAVSPEPERVCVPGVTQVCLGSGACSGAQACNAAGTGFGPCDCGSNPPAVDAPVDGAAGPPGTSAPGSEQPAALPEQAPPSAEPNAAVPQAVDSPAGASAPDQGTSPPPVSPPVQ
jgi:hypothetical protein